MLATIEDGASARCATSAPTSSLGAGQRRVRRADGRLPRADDHRRRARGHGALGRRRERVPPPRDDRPGQPVFAIDAASRAGGSGCARRRPTTSSSCFPACAATHAGEIGSIRSGPTPRDFGGAPGSRSRIGRSWVWIEDGTILFKAEASAWTPQAVQLQQVWVDPPARQPGERSARTVGSDPAAARAGPARVPVRAADNPAAIRLYERVGMKRVGSYRSLLF